MPVTEIALAGDPMLEERERVAGALEEETALALKCLKSFEKYTVANDPNTSNVTIAITATLIFLGTAYEVEIRNMVLCLCTLNGYLLMVTIFITRPVFPKTQILDGIASVLMD